MGERRTPRNGTGGAKRSRIHREADVAIVGGGPAGIAAACAAAESGAAVLMLDEGFTPGGQIHRHLPGREPPAAARPWLERLARSGAEVVPSATVFDAETLEPGAPAGGAFRLHVETAGARLATIARRVVLACGARELFLPFPGWTLPGVMGAGGAQALLKSGARFEGKRVVVAGSGPLLLPVAASFAHGGAEVVMVAEQASLRTLAAFTARLVSHPDKLLEAARHRAAFLGTPYRASTWIREARGRETLEAVVLTDGRSEHVLACDVAAVSYGLVPNVELARLLGARAESGAVVVDAGQRTSVPGLFAAGEMCGIAGVDVALAEGEIAGLTAAAPDGSPAVAEAAAGKLARLRRERSRGRDLASAMDRAFRPRDELRAIPRGDTIVCRCEDVRLETLEAAWSVRQAKLYSRSGMGACQGRVCGPALRFLFGWSSDTVRPPIAPVPLGTLLEEE